MNETVVQFGMPRPVAEELIRKLAREGHIAWDTQFDDKRDERGFTMRQVLETLKEGSVNQGPTKDEYGDWRCRVRRRVAGRLVRVVVAIHEHRILYLVSVH